MCPRRGSIEPEDQPTSSSAHIKVQRPYTEYALVIAARDARVRHSSSFRWTLIFLRPGARIRLEVRTNMQAEAIMQAEDAPGKGPSGELCYGLGGKSLQTSTLSMVEGKPRSQQNERIALLPTSPAQVSAAKHTAFMQCHCCTAGPDCITSYLGLRKCCQNSIQTAPAPSPPPLAPHDRCHQPCVSLSCRIYHIQSKPLKKGSLS
jgi:hypothetical protein